MLAFQTLSLKHGHLNGVASSWKKESGYSRDRELAEKHPSSMHPSLAWPVSPECPQGMRLAVGGPLVNEVPCQLWAQGCPGDEHRVVRGGHSHAVKGGAGSPASSLPTRMNSAWGRQGLSCLPRAFMVLRMRQVSIEHCGTQKGLLAQSNHQILDGAPPEDTVQTHAAGWEHAKCLLNGKLDYYNRWQGSDGLRGIWASPSSHHLLTKEERKRWPPLSRKQTTVCTPMTSFPGGFGPLCRQFEKVWRICDRQHVLQTKESHGHLFSNRVLPRKCAPQ